MSSSEAEDAEQPVLRRRKAQLITTSKHWRREIAKWQREEQAKHSDSEDEQDADPEQKKSTLVPCTLERLFGDAPARPRAVRPALTEEERLMELLANELADSEKIPDDGELEGSGDDYDG